MNDLPSFKDMFYTVRRNNCYAMQKSVAEHLEKRNKAIEMMGWDEGQKYLDETQPPQKGLHVNSILYTPDYNYEKFDPEVFNLAYSSPKGGGVIGGFYESTLMPNKRFGRHSNAQYAYSGGRLNGGIITELYPDAPILHIRTQKDWDDLYNRFRSQPEHDNKHRFIPIQNLLRDYDAIQIDTHPNEEHMEWGSESEKKLEDLYSEKGKNMGDSTFSSDSDFPFAGLNHRFILNPYAVMTSYPYSMNDDIRHESPRTENYAPYDRKKALEKLGQRYKDAGIEYDWEPFTPSSDNSSSES